MNAKEFKIKLRESILHTIEIHGEDVPEPRLILKYVVNPLVDMLYEVSFLDDPPEPKPAPDIIGDSSADLDAAIGMLSHQIREARVSEHNPMTDAIALIRRCITEYRSQIEEHLKVRGELQDENTKLRETVRRLVEEREEASKTFLQENRTIRDRTAADAEESQSRIHELQNEAKHMQSQIDRQREQIIDLRNASTRLHAQVHELQETKVNQQGIISRYMKRVDGDTATIVSLQGLMSVIHRALGDEGEEESLALRVQKLKSDRDKQANLFAVVRRITNYEGPSDGFAAYFEVWATSAEAAQDTLNKVTRQRDELADSLAHMDTEKIGMVAACLHHEEALRAALSLNRNYLGPTTPWKAPAHEPLEDITAYIVRMSKSLEEWINGLRK